MIIKIFEAQYGHQKYPPESKITDSKVIDYLSDDIRLVLKRKNSTIEIICYISALESYSRSEMYYVFYQDSISQNTFEKFQKDVSAVLSKMELQLSNNEKNNMFKHIINFDQKSHESFDIEYSALAKSIEHKEKLEYNHGNYDSIAKLFGKILYNSNDIKIVIQSGKNSNIFNADVSIYTDFSERHVKATDATHKIIEKYKSNIQLEKRKLREHEENEKRTAIADESYRSIKRAVQDLRRIGQHETDIVNNLIESNVFSKNSINKITLDFNKDNAGKSHLGQQDYSFSNGQSPYVHTYNAATVRPEAAKGLDKDKNTKGFLNFNARKGNNSGEKKNVRIRKEHSISQPHPQLKSSSMEGRQFPLIGIVAIIVVFAIILAFVFVLYPLSISNVDLAIATNTSAPQITSITPTQIPASTFILTIIGTNFDTNATVQILNADKHLDVNRNILNRTDTKIVVSMTETEGDYVVQVKNADGKFSNDMYLAVTAPPTSPPQITSIDPTEILASSFKLTIIGTNFENHANVQILKADSNLVGYITNIISQTNTKIVVRHYISETEGVYVVNIKNADGQLSNDKHLAVTAPPTSPPQIISIDPIQVRAGTFDLIITGTNFDTDTVDIFWKADGSLVGQGTIINQTSTEIVVNMTESEGVYVVKVKNSDGQLSNGMDLTINSV